MSRGIDGHFTLDFVSGDVGFTMETPLPQSSASLLSHAVLTMQQDAAHCRSLPRATGATAGKLSPQTSPSSVARLLTLTAAPIDSDADA